MNLTSFANNVQQDINALHKIGGCRKIDVDNYSDDIEMNYETSASITETTDLLIVLDTMKRNS